MSRDYFVYMLLNPLKNNEPFYIGKGKNRRFQDHFIENRKKTNSHKNNTIKQILKETGNNPQVIIHVNNLSEEDAFVVEINLIKFYGRKKDGGILTNVMEGGEGISGINRPYASKNFGVISRPGSLNGMYGKKHTEESKLNMSITTKNKYKKRYHWNNGIKSIMTEFPPDDSWIKGRLQEHKCGLKVGR